MRDYGKVYTAFWTSEDARSLSEDGRSLALYLMTCPHGNMLGCFRLTDAYAADDLQWKPERVRKGFDELYEKGFAYRCERTFWVVIRYYLKWNQFENPNVGLAASKMFTTLNAPMFLKATVAVALREFAPRFPAKNLDEFERNLEPFENPFGLSSKTRTKPEPQPQPQPEQKLDVELPLDVPVKVDPVEEVFDYWRKRMNSPRSELDKDRRKYIENALKTYSPREICEAIKGCSLTPHNMGVNDNKTKYNGINVILRSADNIDRFIGTARARPDAQNADEPQTEDQLLADVQAALNRMTGGVSECPVNDPNVIDMEMPNAQH